jgi:hypothetical protein
MDDKSRPNLLIAETQQLLVFLLLPGKKKKYSVETVTTHC